MDNQNDSNVLSPYIRPVITILVVLVFLMMIVLGKNIPEIFWYIVLGVMTFWFGERFLAKYASTIKNGSISSPEIKQTIQDAIKQVTEEPITEDEPVIVSPVAPPKPEIPFDEKAFMDLVDKTTQATYTVKNPSTTFYNAERQSMGWPFDSEKQWKECQKVLSGLAGEAFKSIWGVDFDTAQKNLNSPAGCTTCAPQGCTYPDLKFKALQLGLGYYTSYLDYVRMADKVA